MIGEEEPIVKVIFITSVSFSGSTLLDFLVGSSPEAFSLGEIKAFDAYRKGQLDKCTCGKRFLECEFWSEVQKILPERALNKAETERCGWGWVLSHIFWRQNKSFNKPNNGKYELFKAIADVASREKYKGEKLSFLVDSSKDVSCMIKLNEDSRIKVFNLHLVRDGRGCAYSAIKRGRRFYKTIMRWIIIHFLTVLYIRRHKVESIRISYDELFDDPKRLANAIKEFVGVNLGLDPVASIKRETYHVLGGNRMRWSKNELEAFEVQRPWCSEKSWVRRTLSHIITLPFNKLWVWNKRPKNVFERSR